MALAKETIIIMTETDSTVVVKSTVNGELNMVSLDKASPTFDEDLGVFTRDASRSNFDTSYTAPVMVVPDP